MVQPELQFLLPAVSFLFLSLSVQLTRGFVDLPEVDRLCDCALRCLLEDNVDSRGGGASASPLLERPNIHYFFVFHIFSQLTKLS